MDLQAAESLVKAEIASGSPLAKALLLLLKETELEAYRASSRAADPIAMSRICGKGEGLHQFTKLITPTQANAPTGPSAL
jgi:hypothetical protein